MKKSSKIIYWIATIWLALGMTATGFVQLFKGKEGQGGLDMVTHLGYPVYLITILGVWKILGVVALLIPKFPLVKEWAYAGFTFAWISAFVAHYLANDGLEGYLPLVLLAVLFVSYVTRPSNRRWQAG